MKILLENDAALLAPRRLHRRVDGHGHERSALQPVGCGADRLHRSLLPLHCASDRSGPAAAASVRQQAIPGQALVSRLQASARVAQTESEASRNRERSFIRKCPRNCPCQLPEPAFQNQRQPTRLDRGSGLRREGFTGKIEDGREADPFSKPLTRLSGSLRFGASSWSVGSIWGKSGPPSPSRSF